MDPKTVCYLQQRRIRSKRTADSRSESKTTICTANGAPKANLSGSRSHVTTIRDQGTHRIQFRQRYPGPAQKRPPNPEVKKFVICYSCGEEGHYQETSALQKNVKKNDGPLTTEEMKEMLQHFHQIKRFLWRGVTNHASTSEIKEITAECEKIDKKILTIEADIEADEDAKKVQEALNI